MEADSNNTTDKILLSVDEVAFRLGVSKSHAYELIRRQEIPSYKLGRLTKVKPEDLEAYKDGLEVNTFDDPYHNI